MPGFVRFTLALIIVLAGLAWALIWLIGFIKEAKGSDWTSLKRLPAPVAAAWLITGAYALYYYVHSMLIGGTPITRLTGDGRYWLIWYGKSTEVSREVYFRSAAEETITFALFIISMVVTGVMLKDTKRHDPK